MVINKGTILTEYVTVLNGLLHIPYSHSRIIFVIS
jgi:hypothetical protein